MFCGVTWAKKQWSMLNLTVPIANLMIRGTEYELTHDTVLAKYTFDRSGKDPIGKLVEAFDVFRSPTTENKYQIRHWYYNSSKQWTSDTVWFTLAEIRKRGLHDLLENWPIF